MGIQVTCELCWNGHVMGSLCFLVTNARIAICPPRRRHEIALQSADNLPGGFKYFGGSTLPMYTPEAPAMSLQIQCCCLKLSIFSLFEAHCCQDTLDPSLGITLPPALLYLCAIYPDPETQ